MADINEVRDRVAAFVAKDMGKEGRPTTIVGIKKVDEAPVAWEARVQVVEVSEYVEALDIGTTVYDRNMYKLQLDDDNEVISFNRIEPFAIPEEELSPF